MKKAVFLITFLVVVISAKSQNDNSLLFDQYSIELAKTTDSTFNVFIVDKTKQHPDSTLLNGNFFQNLTSAQTEFLLYRLLNEQLNKEASAKFKTYQQSQSTQRLIQGLQSINANKYNDFIKLSAKSFYVGNWEYYGTMGEVRQLTINDDLTISEKGKIIGEIKITSTQNIIFDLLGIDQVQMVCEDSRLNIFTGWIGTNNIILRRLTIPKE